MVKDRKLGFIAERPFIGRFNVILIDISAGILVETDKLVLNFTWKGQEQIANRFFKKRIKLEGLVTLFQNRL